MLAFFTVFTLLLAVRSASPLVGYLNNVNATYNIQAVLVAGSNGFYNYRHQADVCHAYHVLRDHGVSDENIIVFMYDDIANNPQNPYPGKIYNIPDGPDVYQGVPKDYTGKEVTVANFLDALKGDKDLAAKGKKVLNSGPNDHVFIYFADHGGTGTLCFPSGVLTSKDLTKALIDMHRKNLYGKLTFYVEACEAGSMFENILPKNIDVFVTTASNPEESSYGTFCNISGPLDGTCLGDEYSVAWLQDSDKQNLNRETLQSQFETVVKNTPESHPQEYGQKSLSSLEVSEFLGQKSSSRSNFRQPVPSYGQVSSRNIPIYSIRKRISNSNDANQIAILEGQYTSAIAGRQFLKQAITKVISNLCSAGFCSNVDLVFSSRKPLTDHTSYDKVVKRFHSSCVNLSVHTDALKYMYTFANLVEVNKFTQQRLQIFLQTLAKTCSKQFFNNTFDSIV